MEVLLIYYIFAFTMRMNTSIGYVNNITEQYIFIENAD